MHGSKLNAKAPWSYLQYGSTLRFYSNGAGGTFEDVARRSGKSDEEIDALFEELKSRIHSEK